MVVSKSLESTNGICLYSFDLALGIVKRASLDSCSEMPLPDYPIHTKSSKTRCILVATQVNVQQPISRHRSAIDANRILHVNR